MARKKIDRRIIELIQRSIISRHRCMFFVCGTEARDQVPFLHHLLLKCRDEANLEKPSVLWCFKKESSLGGHQLRKRLKLLRRSPSPVCEEDAFDHFLLSADPHCCHYSDTGRVLGRSFSLVVCQDAGALSPNTLARLTECAEGAGVIVFLLPDTLQQLTIMHMNAHSRFVTEAYPSVVPLFNQRLVRSLRSCDACLVLDDRLRIKALPSSENPLKNHSLLQNHSAENHSASTLPELLSALTDRERSVFLLCHTRDQSDALGCLHRALNGPTGVVSLTAGRGRGKSAVLGLAVALAVCGGGSVLLTAPHPENVQIIFTFLAKGLEAMGLKEGPDFQCERDPDLFVTATLILCGGKQKRVCYLPPTHPCASGSLDLLVVDEAAAIPLPLLRGWLGPQHTVFMASTVQGYEGTGRSLSLKLLNQLRDPDNKSSGRPLQEFELKESIRYASGDPIEAWLERLLCLEADQDSFLEGELPEAEHCQLYQVNRVALFSGGAEAESFLHRLVWLFVASHYKNCPDDLLMAADAPAHRLFCLTDTRLHTTPLCAIQVSLEGGLSRETSRSQQANGRRGAGDLIPWIVSQQFQDENFPCLRGARIVRIATHPHCQRMGYGRRALDLLSEFFSTSKMSSPQQGALLWGLGQGQAQGERPLDYLGVSYGLTLKLLKFWTRAGFVPLYIRQTTSEVTGEHSCVMVRAGGAPWLPDLSADFRARFTALLPTAFRRLPAATALQLMMMSHTQADVTCRLSPRGLLRLLAYCRGEVDFHMVLDLMPALAPPLITRLNHAQACALLCVGVQGKSVAESAEELGTDNRLLMSLFRRAVAGITDALRQQKAFQEKKPTSKRHFSTTEEIPQNKSKKFKRSIQSSEDSHERS